MHTPGLPANYRSDVTSSGDYVMSILHTAMGDVTEVFEPSRALAIARDIFAKMLPGSVIVVSDPNAKTG